MTGAMKIFYTSPVVAFLFFDASKSDILTPISIGSEHLKPVLCPILLKGELWHYFPLGGSFGLQYSVHCIGSKTMILHHEGGGEVQQKVILYDPP